MVPVISEDDTTKGNLLQEQVGEHVRACTDKCLRSLTSNKRTVAAATNLHVDKIADEQRLNDILHISGRLQTDQLLHGTVASYLLPSAAFARI